MHRAGFRDLIARLRLGKACIVLPSTTRAQNGAVELVLAWDGIAETHGVCG